MTVYLHGENVCTFILGYESLGQTCVEYRGACVQEWEHIWVNKYVCVDTLTNSHTLSNIYMHTPTHTHTQTHMHTYVYIIIYIPATGKRWSLLQV